MVDRVICAYSFKLIIVKHDKTLKHQKQVIHSQLHTTIHPIQHSNHPTQQHTLFNTPQFLPTRMGCLEDTLYEFPTFANSKAAFPVVWFQEFASWVRDKVNLLAMDDNIRELLVQLQLMGEVSFGCCSSEKHFPFDC